ncbi:MAG TPA: ABC transporter permease [Alphaproteobacteria bacterium]|nr:ABC transporter permease [Alphaproteobacteria bacterium]
MPDWGREVRALLAGLEIDPARAAGITEEISQHLNDRFEELLAQGMAAEKAQQAVIAELSDGTLGVALKSVIRTPEPKVPLGKAEKGSVLSGVWKDLRFGARLLRLSPGFTAVAVLSLALGVGANTAIFQLLDAIRLRSLPVHYPNELAEIRLDHPGRSGHGYSRTNELSYAMWERLQERQQAFSEIAVWGAQRMNVSQSGEAKYVDAIWVSGTFFKVLQLQPELGRLISPNDDQRGCGSPVAVISYGFWQRAFAGDRDALGKMVWLEGKAFTIAGVTPASFFGVEVGRSFDVAVPVCADPLVNGESSRIKDPMGWWLASIARVKPGWTLERASAHLAGISPGIFADTVPPTYKEIDRQHYQAFKLSARSGATGFSPLRKQYEGSLWLLMAISGLVLLIACANLASLLMARASTRQQEMAVRLALGASRSRLVRQLLAESLFLAATGTLLGTALAQILSRSLVSFLSTQNNQVFVNLQPNWHVLAFTAGLALLTCLLFGLAPAFQAAGTAPGEIMKTGGRGLTSEPKRFGLRKVLVVSQVAVSLVLLVGSLLFVRTLQNLLTMDPGFEQDNLLVTDIDLSPLKIPVEQRAAFQQAILERVRTIPGVVSAADLAVVPVSGSSWNDNVSVPGTGIQRKSSHFNMVSPGYFQTMQIRLLAGRDFDQRETAKSLPVAIVNEAFAQQFFGGVNPVGKTVSKERDGGKPDLMLQIVGLVKNTKYIDLREDFIPIVYLPEALATSPDPEALFVLRSSVPMSDMISSVKREMAQMNPAMIMDFTVLKTMIRNALLRERMMATLASFFGFLAVALATIGLYGVISYMVIRRRNEIGVRLALGASRRDILTMILREASVLLGAGLAIGTVLALLAGRSAGTLLYGLKANDPLTLVLGIAGLAAVALLASAVPARRAAGLHPMDALREE